jgi:hypothetical protein
MANFSYLWNNALLTSGILKASRENKAEFGTKTQNKFEQLPPLGAPYAALIASSRTAFDFFISLKDGATLNMQKAATQRLDALLPIIVATGKVLEGKILSEFEADPAVRTEFFPRGRTELAEAKRGDVEGILNRLVARATAHVGALGAGWVTRLTTLRTQWTTNMALQSGAVAQVSSSRSQIDLAWETLSWAFYDLAQQLAIDNPRNAGVADIYFDFSVFTRRTNYDNDGKGLLKILLTNYSGEPLVNARITIKDQNGQLMDEGITNDEGRFTSSQLPIGFYDVLMEHMAYVTQLRQFQVFDNSDPENEVKLTHE